MKWHKLQDKHPPEHEALVIKWGKNEFYGHREVDDDGDFIYCYDHKRHKSFEINLDVPFVNWNIYWRLE